MISHKNSPNYFCFELNSMYNNFIESRIEIYASNTDELSVVRFLKKFRFGENSSAHHWVIIVE